MEATDMVTGALGYIGRSIARELLSSGRSVKTLTTHVQKPNPFGDRVEVFPYHFDQPERLAASLEGIDTLYNTYWVRFDHGDSTFDRALEQTQVLFDQAVRAGVRKIVHISVTRASLDSELPYYRGKAQQEKILAATGLPHAIIRPTLVFGEGDILVNNLAWLLRKFPFFPIFGDGKYRLQPIFVEDLARIAVRCQTGVLDAAGPETYSFEQLMRLMAEEVSPRTRFFRVRPGLGIFLGNIVAALVRDRLLTEDELKGLMQEKLVSDHPPRGTVSFAQWFEQNWNAVGRRYHSELKRHFRWKP